MKTLKMEIPIPEGYQFDRADTTKIVLTEKPKDIKERIKKVEDILFQHNLTMKDVDEMFNNVPEHFKWQYIAELLCETLNEEWIADWDDDNQYKYFPWFYMGGSSGFRYNGYDVWLTGSYVGSRLCLKSSELATYAGKQFTELYKKFMI